ncbi:E3 ubiquitin-protein ligase RNF13-like [Impatiens glandulifera]|uniref:E3 ubiquitin-protein ligase RNF13-like n=1 Tax=Impatiens glandulifera TaxID=253017 RepID=UPI001FB07688|nr:E3 ubiquitin-protein ligase RNF13-like [Impatiens glandulifera]
MIIKKLVSVIYNFKINDIPSPWELLGKGSNNGGGVGEMCCVCLCGMEEGEERRVLTCRHEFHGQCIGRWFDGRRITCPICRRGDHHTEMMMMNDKQFLTEEMLVWFSSFHVAGF